MIALIDGDMLAFNACNPRWLSKVTAKWYDGQQRLLNVVKLDANGEKIPIEFTEGEDTAYLNESYNRFITLYEGLRGKFFCESVRMAVKGEGNFRHDIYPEYKKHRISNPQLSKFFVPVIRDLAVKDGLAVYAHGMEADDLITTWAHELRAENKSYVVISGDKDLKCIPGKFYDLLKEDLIEITPYMAMRQEYTQLLSGDPTDNIPGIYKVGPVKAGKIVAHCATEEDFQIAVINEYMAAYGDNWYDHLYLNYRLIHLQRFVGDTELNWEIIQELRK